MKVILQQDIKGTGKKGEIIEASDGYARNFLFPKKLAVAASNTNINSVENAKKAEQHRKDVEKQEAQQLASIIDTLSVTIRTKTGEGGRLFGAITSKEIAEELFTQHKVKVDKKKITVANIKGLGEFTATIKLYADVTASLKVLVVQA